jgi:hypothetical protein
MKRQILWILGIVYVFLSILLFMTQSFAYEKADEGDKFFISGTIMDSHKEPIKDVRIKVLVSDRPQMIMVKQKWVEETETSSNGTYQVEFRLQPGQISNACVQFEISKPSYRKTKVDLKKEDLAQKGQSFYAVKNVEMQRTLSPAFYIATFIFLLAYLTKAIPGAAESNVLWWALALGVCFGGNGTIIGASANVVTVGIAEASGHHISFFGFMKYAFLYMLISVAICNVWLLIFY